MTMINYEIEVFWMYVFSIALLWVIAIKVGFDTLMDIRASWRNVKLLTEFVDAEIQPDHGVV